MGPIAHWTIAHTPRAIIGFSQMHLMQLVKKLTLRPQLMTFIGFERIHLMESARLYCWQQERQKRGERISGIFPVQSPDNEEVLWIPKTLRATQISLLPGCYWRRATERHAISHILKDRAMRAVATYGNTDILTYLLALVYVSFK